MPYEQYWCQSRYCPALAEERLKLARRDRLVLSRLLIRVQNLSALHTQHGEAGSAAGVRALAESIRRSFRASDVAARVGEDEFVVLTAHLGNYTAQALQRLRERLRETEAEAGVPAPLHLEFNVTHFDGELPGSGAALLRPLSLGLPVELVQVNP